MTRAIMIQGTGSNVGKSMVVAGLCRAIKNRNLKVAPFKPQNMSNNAAVTSAGQEIGRAQALQARACGQEADVRMNPILLKPESETGSQVIVEGKRLTTVSARDYAQLKPKLMKHVLTSFNSLKEKNDLVIVEGAGSPAEINLREGDIANMGFAVEAEVPVVLCGDIDRGGVIAQIVGTEAVLDLVDRKMVKGFLINKFRGDISLFDEGYTSIEKMTNWKGLGVIPWFESAWKLPAEDSMDIRSVNKNQAKFKVVCLCLSRMANFDDLDPISQEPDIDLVMLTAGNAIPGNADLVIIPGTKSTIGDLKFLREQRWDLDLAGHINRGGYVLGICGGYQILGKTISDPDGIEGATGSTEGLGYLDVQTTMTANKKVTPTAAVHLASGTQINGYEIHIGDTIGNDCSRPFATSNGTPDGAITLTGQIMGTYLHGLFSNNSFRRYFLKNIGAKPSNLDYDQEVENILDKLGDHMEKNVDIEAFISIAR